MLSILNKRSNLFLFMILTYVSFTANATDEQIVKAIEDSATKRETVIDNALKEYFSYDAAKEYNKNLVTAESLTASAPGENEAETGKLLISKYGPLIKQLNVEQEQVNKSINNSFLNYMILSKDVPATGSEATSSILEIKDPNHILDVHLQGYCDPSLFNQGQGLFQKDKLCKAGSPNSINKDLSIDFINKSILNDSELTQATRAFYNATMPIVNNDLAKMIKEGQSAFRLTENRDKATKILAQAAIFSSVNEFYSSLLAQRKSITVQDDEGTKHTTSELKSIEDIINGTLKNKKWHEEIESSISTNAILKAVLLQVAAGNELKRLQLLAEQRNGAMLASILTQNYMSSLAIDKILSQAPTTEPLQN